MIYTNFAEYIWLDGNPPTQGIRSKGKVVQVPMEPTADDFLAAAQQACRQWGDRDSWRAIQLNGMTQDFSWQQSAERYRALYREAINVRGDA